MKRSEVNVIVDNAHEFLKKSHVMLPSFGYFTLDEWMKKDKSVYEEVFDVGLGWDVTDFSGVFDETGLVLFTLRNGSYKLKEKYKKGYAEKYIIMKEGQVLPYHFHWNKMEDIVNRGTVNMCIKLYNATKDEEFNEKEDVYYRIDGGKYKTKAGETIVVSPGQSISLPPYQYHSFWPEKGMLLIGEVSAVNDDENDNRFKNPISRFSQIEEDEKTKWILCNEYRNKLSL